MKKSIRPSTHLAPVPVVLVSCGNGDKTDIVTVAWTGTINSEPPMLSVSLRPSRYSYSLIKESGEFVVNLVDRALLEACDGCGIVSGRDVDKFEKFSLTPAKSMKVGAPSVAESPISLECVVRQTIELGTHVLFLAEIVAATAEEKWLDGEKLHIADGELVAYVQNRYLGTGTTLGTFGFTAKKNR